MSIILEAGLNKLDASLIPLVLPPSYEVIEPVLLKSLEYPPDCSLDIVSVDFGIGSQLCHPLEPVWPRRDVCYYPFRYSCQVNYDFIGAGEVAAKLIAVKTEDYNAWLSGLTPGYAHHRQSWDPDPYITYYTGCKTKEDISFEGSYELSYSRVGIMLDINYPGTIEFLMQDYVMSPGSYIVLLWFDLYSLGVANYTAYGARIYQIGNATIR